MPSEGVLHVRAVVRVAAAIALTGCSLAARTMAPDHASHVTPHPTMPSEGVLHRGRA